MKRGRTSPNEIIGPQSDLWTKGQTVSISQLGLWLEEAKRDENTSK